MKRKVTVWLGLLLVAMPVSAQRIQQELGRGVVAVQNGTEVTVTWRRLAQEPESATYNLYVDGEKINDSPLTNTNYKTTTGKIPVGSEVAVSILHQGVESEPCTPYTMESRDFRNMFMKISFAESPLTAANYTTDYVWPADLDGDGEMDYVLNRKSLTTGLDNYVEAYLRTGEHLWTVKLGPNELSCAGQDDMILAYDMDCDGKAEVVVQTSDGTQFWNPEKKTFGLFVNGHTTGDTDGDGIIDYETQSTRNAPRYMTVIDGMTGQEKSSIEQTYNSAYNRTNRESLMGDEYNKHVGHVGVFYHDGIHPAVIMEWHIRYSNGGHAYFNSAFAYDFAAGTAGEWKELYCKPSAGPAFHQIRIADLDADGKDEMTTGGYTMNEDGETLYRANIAHGDRFRTSDIDPERPGLETFAIQQNAGDMLGQILYDAATGEAIKKWYLASVGDVGRGECMDVDPNHLGWEMWSTMGGIYNAKGELIPEHTAPYPTEGIWWDSDPDRELVNTSDSHHNVYIQDFYKGRLIEIAKHSGYRYVTVYAKRAAFWGDIIGDWREELVLLHKEGGVCLGIAGFTTDYATSIDNIYCLQEDPAYRMQCTTKGYYQSPNTGFYLGYDMPRPQLPPCMVTDLVCKASGQFTDYTRVQDVAYTNGKSVLLDLNTEEQIDLGASFEPSVLYVMPVKGQQITLGNGSIAGTCDVWKSQGGTLCVNTPITTTGTTYVSEGTLELNATMAGTLDLRARGTLSGNAVLNGDVVFEKALNYEGARLSPGNAAEPLGVITFNKDLNIDKKIYVELNVGASGSDLVLVNGNLTVSSGFVIHLKPTDAKLAPGEYKLMEWTGTLGGKLNGETGEISESVISTEGLQGYYYSLVQKDKALFLVVNEQREASSNVYWTGQTDYVWNYETDNFMLEGETTRFVANDAVFFTDAADRKTIELNESYPVSGLTFNAEKNYVIRGTGGFSGEGGMTKTGNGNLTLSSRSHTFTGPVSLEGGVVSVATLADGGMESSLGAAPSSSGNLMLKNVTLDIQATDASTNRIITLQDTVAVRVNQGVASFKNIVNGAGVLVKEGAGQLNFNYGGRNTYSKGTVLREGTLAMGAWNTSFGVEGSRIRAEKGLIRMFDINESSMAPVFNYVLEVPEGGDVFLQAGSRCRIAGSWEGTGRVRYNAPYVRADVQTNFSNFEGTLQIENSDFRLNQSTDMSKTAVVLTGTTYMGHFKAGGRNTLDGTTKIGSLASTDTGTGLGYGTWEVGYNNKNTSFSGRFDPSATVIKCGTGTLTLKQNQTKGFTVREGEVSIAADVLVDASVSVNAGARLSGRGDVTTVNVMKDGTIEGYLTVNDKLTVSSGGKVAIRKLSSTNTKVYANGTVSMTSPVIEIENAEKYCKEGDAIPVILDFASLSVRGDVTIVPEMPGEGLEWDLSTFATDGIVHVVKATDVQFLTAEEVQVRMDGTYCKVSWGATAPTEISMLDAAGRTIAVVVHPEGTAWSIDLSSYPKGLYVVELSANGATLEKKILR